LQVDPSLCRLEGSVSVADEEKELGVLLCRRAMTDAMSGKDSGGIEFTVCVEIAR
jgi:hypothetical protein